MSPETDLATLQMRIVELEKSWEDFGSDASKKRFTELLASEPALKAKYDENRKKKRR